MKRLSETALLVRVSVRLWTGERIDREFSDYINTQADADRNAGIYKKKLIDPKQFKELRAKGIEIRKLFGDYTVPWANGGIGLLSSELYLTFTQRLQELSREFEELYLDFFQIYPDLVASAPERLEKLFRMEDYPSVEELRTKYGVETNFYPLPESGDFRVKLRDSEIDALKSQFDQNMEKQREKIKKDLFQRLYKIVQKMAEKLEDPRGIFRDSLVANLQDFIELLPQLNVFDDPAVEELRAQVKSKLATRQPSQLREFPEIRERTARDAREIIDQMKDYMI